MERNNILIIGSGLGGLVCGYILSKNGYRVTILEKNPNIGGCLQTFTRNNVKFDTGMHYIGSMEKEQILYRFFSYLNLLDIPLNRLDDNGYDIISLDGQEYKYASGYDKFLDTLSEQFPNNIEEIRLYLKSISEIATNSPLYDLQKIGNGIFTDNYYLKTSVNEHIASFTNNNLLQNVLSGTLPLYAGTKDKTPAYIHALINNFYIQSAYRIIGGSDQIAASLANSIRKNGGEILINSEVEEIICNDTKATSVRLSNGTILYADYFISNLHPQITIQKLNTGLIRKAYRERILSLENTISNFTLYIKFKEKSVPYLNYNYYFYQTDDVWSANQYSPDKWPESYLYMHQCHAKDPVYAQSAEIISYMRYEETQKWEKNKIGVRGSDYTEFKEERSQKLLNKLEQSFPGTISCIDSYYASTPLTYCDYTATPQGSTYGIIRDKSLPVQTMVSPRTKIPNLFMTGQNINFHGILGVITGSIITSAEFLGIHKIIDQIDKTNH